MSAARLTHMAGGRIGFLVAVRRRAFGSQCLLAGAFPQFLATWTSPLGCSQCGNWLPSDQARKGMCDGMEATVFLSTCLGVIACHLHCILFVEANQQMQVMIQERGFHRALVPGGGDYWSHRTGCLPPSGFY